MFEYSSTNHTKAGKIIDPPAFRRPSEGGNATLFPMVCNVMGFKSPLGETPVFAGESVGV
jgi:hypothetical protein